MSAKLSLTQLNSHVLIGKPADTSRSVEGAKNSPSLIILFGYMDARSSHLQKYIDGLYTEFPTAEMVVIKSFSNFFWSSNKHLESVLMPAMDVLKAHAETNKNSARILVHVVSNGGGFNYMTFHKLLEKSATPGQASLMPDGTPTALILDSTPGDNGLKSSISFAAPANPLLRIFLIPPIAFLYGVFYAINTACGNMPIFDQLRATLLSESVLPTIIGPGRGVNKTSRMYIYSKIDKIADPAEIQAHIDVAKESGFDVRTEVYENTSHVGHARVYPERYWGSVRQFWADVLDAKPVDASL